MEDKTEYSEETLNIGLQTTFREAFTAILALLTLGKQKELTYVKTTIGTPDGGTYLISIIHIDGPKIDLDLLRVVSNSQKETKE